MQFVIRAQSLLGHPAWLAKVTEGDVFTDMMPIISLSSERDEALLMSQEEARDALVSVHTTHPEAVIEENYRGCTN